MSKTATASTFGSTFSGVLSLRAAFLSTGLAALGVGCGGSGLCDRVNGVAANVATKAQGCAAVGSAVSHAMFTQSACLVALSRCSETDQRALNAQVDCLLKLPACTPGQEAQFLSALGPCKFSGAAVSSACANALETP